MKYNDSPTTLNEQLKILSERGLIISKKEKALSFLQSVSYYRFCGYALHFEEFQDRKRTHVYKLGTTFEDVAALYDFDSELRSLLFSYIEHIEVAFRTQLCLQVSLSTKDSHWPLDRSLFKESFDHGAFLSKCRQETKRSKEVFIQSYKNKYSEPELPASWMLIEIVPFGAWSRIYSKLKDPTLKKSVADYFQTADYLLQSWIHAINILRNQCAHHSRLWNASVTVEPTLSNRMKKAYPLDSLARTRIVLLLDIISELLKPLGKYEQFISSLGNLLGKYPTLPIASMGLRRSVLDIQKGVRPEKIRKEKF